MNEESEFDQFEVVAPPDKNRKTYDEWVERFQSGRPLGDDKRLIEKLDKEIQGTARAAYPLLDVLVQAGLDETNADTAVATTLSDKSGDELEDELTKLLSCQADARARMGRLEVPIQAEAQRWLFPGQSNTPRVIAIAQLLELLRSRFMARSRSSLFDRINAGLDSASKMGSKYGERWDTTQDHIRKLADKQKVAQATFPPSAGIHAGTEDIIAGVERLVERSTQIGTALATARREPTLGERGPGFVKQLKQIHLASLANAGQHGMCTPELWLQIDAYTSQLDVKASVSAVLDDLSKVNAYQDKTAWNVPLGRLRVALGKEAEAARMAPMVYQAFESFPGRAERDRSSARGLPLDSSRPFDSIPPDEWFQPGYRVAFKTDLDHAARACHSYADIAERAASALGGLRVTDPDSLPAWESWSAACRTALAFLSKELQLASARTEILQVTEDAIKRSAAKKLLPDALQDLSRFTLDHVLRQLAKGKSTLGKQLQSVFGALQPGKTLDHTALALSALQLDHLPVAAYLAASFPDVPPQLGLQVLSAIQERRAVPELPMGVFRLFGDHSPQWSRLWEAYNQLARLAEAIDPVHAELRHPLAETPAGKSLASWLADVRAVSLPKMFGIWPGDLDVLGERVLAELARWREELCARIEVRLAVRLAVEPGKDFGRAIKPWRGRELWEVVDERWADLVDSAESWFALIPELTGRNRRAARGETANALLGLRTMMHVRPVLADGVDLVADAVSALTALFNQLTVVCPAASVVTARESLQRWLRLNGAWLVAAGLSATLERDTQHFAQEVVQRVFGDHKSTELATGPRSYEAMHASLADLQWLSRTHIDRISQPWGRQVRAMVPVLDRLRENLGEMKKASGSSVRPGQAANAHLSLARTSLEVGRESKAGNEPIGAAVGAFVGAVHALLARTRTDALEFDPDLAHALKARLAEHVRFSSEDVEELMAWCEAGSLVIEDAELEALRRHLHAFPYSRGA